MERRESDEHPFGGKKGRLKVFETITMAWLLNHTLIIVRF